MTKMQKNYDTVIAGGGAAGIVAAITARRSGASVLLCEKMPKLGKKIRISGNGRCNITNDALSSSGFNPEAKEIVESVFSRFGKHEILGFFKELGLRVYSDKKDGRVFPITNQSASVMDVLELELSKLSVEVRLDCEVTGIKKTHDCFSLRLKSGDTVNARHAILTAGGKSYPIGGTDGSAYALALGFGHHLVEPAPITVPLLSKDPWCAQLTGQKITAVVRARVNGKTGPKVEGDLLFTDYGLSGTAILDSSDDISIALVRSQSKDTAVVIDLVPFIHEEELKKELSHRMRRKFPSDKLLAGILPPKFSNVLADVLKERDPAEITSVLKHRVFEVTGTRGWNDAEFTAGGIDHHEVDERTLESKKCPGLYLAGEILNVQGKRGGFNLAWAWASGFVVGSEMKKRVLAFLLFFLMTFPAVSQAKEPLSRGLFVSVIQDPPVLSSREEIKNLIVFAKKAHVQTLYVQVYRANQSWFPSKIADQRPYETCFKNISGDPFALLIKEAHASGIEVHAWLNLLSLSTNTNAPILKKYGSQILTRNIKPKGKITDYKIDDQYFLEPGDLRVREELSNIVEELVRTYPELDGIQFDYIRYPDTQPHYGFTKMNMGRFKKMTGQKRIVEESEAWKKWKRDQVTDLLEALIKKARAIHPDIQLSATGCMPYVRANQEAYQDWASWLKRDLVDFMTIMSYPPDIPEFKKYVSEAKIKSVDFKKVNVGIGAYKLLKTPEIFERQLELCEESNARSCVILHYGSLTQNPALASRLVSSKKSDPASRTKQ